VSTAAVLNLVPPPGKILLSGVIYYLRWINLSWNGTEESKNDEPILLKGQDAPCFN
jgi:hypothetical protein